MSLGTHYLSDSDGTNAILFTGDLGQPWPQDPQIKFNRATTEHRMIPGWSGSTTPGRRVIIDAGTHTSIGDIEINLPYIDAIVHAELRAKESTVASMLWSPDAGTTVYLVAWQNGISYDPTPKAGFIGYYEGKLKLHIISTSVTSISLSGMIS